MAGYPSQPPKWRVDALQRLWAPVPKVHGDLRQMLLRPDEDGTAEPQVHAVHRAASAPCNAG